MISGGFAIAPLNVYAVKNLVSESIDTDGTPFNGGLGYITGYRINSAGGLNTESHQGVTGFIAVSPGDVIRAVNIGTSIDHYNILMQVYDSNFESLGSLVTCTSGGGGYIMAAIAHNANSAYIRVGFGVEMAGRVIVTRNQPISPYEDLTATPLPIRSKEWTISIPTKITSGTHVFIDGDKDVADHCDSPGAYCHIVYDSTEHTAEAYDVYEMSAQNGWANVAEGHSVMSFFNSSVVFSHSAANIPQLGTTSVNAKTQPRAYVSNGTGKIDVLLGSSKYLPAGKYKIVFGWIGSTSANPFKPNCKSWVISIPSALAAGWYTLIEADADVAAHYSDANACASFRSRTAWADAAQYCSAMNGNLAHKGHYGAGLRASSTAVVAFTIDVALSSGTSGACNLCADSSGNIKVYNSASTYPLLAGTYDITFAW